MLFIDWLRSNIPWIANIATVAAALLAATGLFLTQKSISRSAKVADATALFLIARELRDAEARLANAGTSSDAELNNYFNLLEILASSINHKLLGRASRMVAQERLILDLAIIENNKTIKSKLFEAIQSPKTFSALRTFIKRNRKQIRAQAASVSSSSNA